MVGNHQAAVSDVPVSTAFISATQLDIATLRHPEISCPIIKHIPKSARSSCAKLLTDILLKIINSTTDTASWSLLLNYTSTILSKPRQTSQKESLTSIIKKRANNYLSQPDSITVNSHIKFNRRNLTDEQLSKNISAKIEDGNIRSALRMLMSDDKPADDDDLTYQKLLERHPPADPNRKSPTNPALISNQLQVTDMRCLRQFAVFLQAPQEDQTACARNISLIC